MSLKIKTWSGETLTSLVQQSSVCIIILCQFTFGLRWAYDARAASVRRQPVATGLSYGFTGAVASTILFNSALWQILKNGKPVARRHAVRSIARSSHGHCTEAARWSCGQHKILDGHLGKNNRTIVVGSWDIRTVSVQLSQGAARCPCSAHKIARI